MKRWHILSFILLLGSSVALSFGEIRDPDRHDVNDLSYTSTVISVGTSQVEAKVGGTRNALRQRIILYNDSNSVIYYGPTGVTTTGSTKGIPVYKKQIVVIPVGDVAIYLIAGSASNDVIVQELQ